MTSTRQKTYPQTIINTVRFPKAEKGNLIFSKYKGHVLLKVLKGVNRRTAYIELVINRLPVQIMIARKRFNILTIRELKTCYQILSQVQISLNFTIH